MPGPSTPATAAIGDASIRLGVPVRTAPVLVTTEMAGLSAMVICSRSSSSGPEGVFVS